MNTKLTKLAAGVGLALSLGFSSSAYAIAYGDAILRLIDFQFLNVTDGGAVVAGTDIDIIGATTTANTDATLRGVSATPRSGVAPVGTPIDLIQTCIGDCPQGTGVDEYTPLSTQAGGGLDAASIPTSDVVFSESDQSGAAISIPGLGIPGVLAETRATAALQNTGIGDANSNLGLNTRFLILASQDFTLGYSFGYDLFLRALLTPDENVPPAFVQARANWNVTVTQVSGETGDSDGDGFEDGDTIALSAPIQINRGRSATLPGDDFQTSIIGGSVTNSSLADLVAGRQYEITISHVTGVDVQSDVSDIPEPGSLLLLGGGLLGLGAVRRRIKK